MADTPYISPTFDEVCEIVRQYMKDRHWDSNPARGLAISIALEANELLEHYQWQEEPVGSKQDISNELADILIYAIQFAQVHDIDINQAILDKLDKASKKYPVEKFVGTNAETQREAWLKAKASYKKDTIL